MSQEMKVLAIDLFGNRAGLTSIGLKVTPTSTPVTKSTNAGTPGAAPYGEAGFASDVLATSTAGTLNLTTQASGVTAANTASATIQAVNDLEACDGLKCDNVANNNATGKIQKTAGQITTTTDFFQPTVTNVLLSTQFVPGTQTNQAACGNTSTNKTIGDATDVKVAGLNAAGTAPSASIVLILPKDTLKFYGITARGTDQFDLCLGAINLLTAPDPSPTHWKGKDPKKKNALINSTSGVENREWGIPANCGTAGLAASDPCIGIRTKQASTAASYLTSKGWSQAQIAALGLKDADLVIVLLKTPPWDGKTGIKPS
jgi:hypothetical protein